MKSVTFAVNVTKKTELSVSSNMKGIYTVAARHVFTFSVCPNSMCMESRRICSLYRQRLKNIYHFKHSQNVPFVLNNDSNCITFQKRDYTIAGLCLNETKHTLKKCPISLLRVDELSNHYG